MLSADQEQIFNDVGFIVLRKIFDQKEISIINSEFNSGSSNCYKELSIPGLKCPALSLSVLAPSI